MQLPSIAAFTYGMDSVGKIRSFEREQWSAELLVLWNSFRAVFCSRLLKNKCVGLVPPMQTT